MSIKCWVLEYGMLGIGIWNVGYWNMECWVLEYGMLGKPKSIFKLILNHILNQSSIMSENTQFQTLIICIYKI